MRSLVFLVVVLCRLVATLHIDTGELQVPFGRSLTLDPDKHLKIQGVQNGARCTVKVIQSDPVTLRPGRISVSQFPCLFALGDVHYVHYGSRTPDSDSVRLLVRFDSHKETTIMSSTLKVHVLFDQLEIVARNLPLTVSNSLGLSEDIDDKVLHFAYDTNKEECSVATMPKNTLALPRYGSLVNESQPGTFRPCSEFLNSDIRYKHESSTSSNRDSIPLVVRVGEKEEHFQIPVRISQAQPNTPPQPSSGATLRMDVNQFVTTAITPAILAAEDVETQADLLIFNITGQPGEGHVVSTDDPEGHPLTSFYQKDLRELKIAYRPPYTDSNTRRIFQVDMVIVDGEGMTSDPFSLMIVVKPMHTLSPLATKISGLSLFEGQSRTIVAGKNLQIADEDNLANIRISVVDGLRHGRLLLNDTPVTHLSPADLESGLVTYQHDGSDTYTDNIIFKLDDGSHQVEFLFPVSIYPEDDEPPILKVNVGLDVSEGEDTQVTTGHLSATDIDSDDDTIAFHLQPEKPGDKPTGVFILKQSTTDPAQNWTLGGKGLYERVVTSWTQRDVQEGRLYFRYAGPHSRDSRTHTVTVRLKDDNHTPNLSPENQVSIKISPKDATHPTLYPGATLQMTVDEHQLGIITDKHLRYTDHGDTPDGQLTIRITRKPYDTDTNDLMDPGKLVEAEQPDQEVVQFTQAQINHHKIAYLSPPGEIGLVPRMVHFEFEVTDSAGNTSPPQEFMILLRPVNNKAPVVHNAGLEVKGGRLVIGPEVLDAIDPDTDPNLIRFVLSRAPSHGSIHVHGRELGVGSAFNKSDLLDGSVSYVSHGGDSTQDEIQLEVSDGHHKVPVSVSVRLEQIQSKGIKADELALSGSHVEVHEAGRVLITSEHIRSSSRQRTSSVTFHLSSPPSHGSIEVDGKPSDTFKLEDVEQQRVHYVHGGAEMGFQHLTDSLNLTVSSENSSHSLHVVTRIRPTDNTPPSIAPPEILSLPEGGKAAISLNVSDPDTPKEGITCNLHLQPLSGFIENMAPDEGSEIPRQGVPVASFPLSAVLKQHVHYVQSMYSGVEPKQDKFTFVCTDGINTSPQTTYPITIEPVNDETPTIYTQEFVVTEGSDLIFDRIILNADDLDVPLDNLTFSVVREPLHGSLVSLLPTGVVRIKEFSMDQVMGLRGSPVAYQHDGSESKSDELELELSDGVHRVRQRITVNVVAVDDETPRLRINEGMRVDIGEVTTITARQLRAHDLDTDHQLLTFIVRRKPKHGYLMRVEGSSQRNLTVGSNFTQSDIDAGYIKYVHTGKDGVRDVLKFDVTDGHNTLVDQRFSILVETVDRIFPDVINKGVELPEGGRVVLTTDILSTSDLNSEDHLLRFIIKRHPLRGRLESADRRGVRIETFTQLDLAAHKISYVHTSPDEIKADSFEFEVTDGHNSVFRTFSISISDVDNKRPVLFLHTLRMREGGHHLITPFELRVEDRDTADQKLLISVVRPPAHGRVLYNRSYDIPGLTFSMDDIMQNRISYLHDGSETTEDSLTLTVTDGVHRDFFAHPNLVRTTLRPQLLNISLIPVDNQPPQIVVNRGSSAIVWFTNPIDRYGMRISDQELRAEDRDSPSKSLVYHVTKHPQHGYLLRGTDAQVDSFTQGELDAKEISYIIKGGTNATSDSFTFTVVDAGGNAVKDQEFPLKWAYVSLEQVKYVVNEADDYLRVVLNRRGYLGETAFVEIKLKNGTAKEGHDFGGHYAKQVQFSPGQMEAEWKVQIYDDDAFEKTEEFEVELGEAIKVAIENPSAATVRIRDVEDESVVFFRETIYSVAEESGEIRIPIERKGDLSRELVVICSTESGSATGSGPGSIQSFSDFVSRGEDRKSVVRFHRNQRVKNCTVRIVDDTLHEEDESFYLRLTLPMGGRVVHGTNLTKIIIRTDSKDKPVIRFAEPEYIVEERVGHVKVGITRVGTDLTRTSRVTIQSRPITAREGKDYVGVGQTVEFPAGVAHQEVKVKIMDDLGLSHVEGLEKFQLQLSRPINASLGKPNLTTIIIYDNVTDLPRFQFKEFKIEVPENVTRISVRVQRKGDIRHWGSVVCYTQQDTAIAGKDFEERPNTNISKIDFEPGAKEKECVVILKDDSTHEKEESFRLLLSNPQSELPWGAAIGSIGELTVIVQDHHDRPTIKPEKVKLIIREPAGQGKTSVAQVWFVRTGDLEQTSVIRIHTRDGSATSGKDYFPISTELEFAFNVSRANVEVVILADEEAEYRETFSLHIQADKKGFADLKGTKVVVYIEDREGLADVTFPTRPEVISLQDYDSTLLEREDNPISGYPLICVTACNPKHSEFGRTGPLCTREGIDDSRTHFRWRVAQPGAQLREVEFATFFAGTRNVTLDSIYFSAGSRAQCLARAVSHDGDEGAEAASIPIRISTTRGICLPEDTFGAEPFIAKMRYTGSEDTQHPNLIRLQVRIPHRDGLLPVVSTRPPINLEFILSKHALRLAQHPCSNLLDVHELHTTHGFIDSEIKKPIDTYVEEKPYQFDSRVREETTLRFYSNLDLDACMWEFISYFNMSELVTLCGGKITTNGQVFDEVQSYVSVGVPLYVSYVLRSDAGWQHSDLVTQLRMNFVYDTAIMWNQGIRAQDTSSLQGQLFPTGMTIGDDGKLTVTFRTKPSFPGHFILGLPDEPSLTSHVMSPNQSELNFHLELVQNEKPEQIWKFSSDYSVRDYSGLYHIKLVPCVDVEDEEQCRPQEPVTFDLPIRFQQVSDPVPAEFSLNTQFHLLKDKLRWMTYKTPDFQEDFLDTTFLPGEKVYGQICVDPMQNLGQSFRMSIEKCFLCTGSDGYIPKYNPQQGEFGCISQSPRLHRVFKIIDKGSPETVATSFGDNPFNATLAEDIRDVDKNGSWTPGMDGFLFNSAPLFEAAPGKQWFVHCIYTIKSELAGRTRRETVAEGIEGIGSHGKGTNMHRIPLYYDPIASRERDHSLTDAGRFLPLVIAAIFCLLAVAAAGILLVRKRRLNAMLPTSVVTKDGQTFVQQKSFHNPSSFTEKTEV